MNELLKKNERLLREVIEDAHGNLVVPVRDSGVDGVAIVRKRHGAPVEVLVSNLTQIGHGAIRFGPVREIRMEPA